MNLTKVISAAIAQLLNAAKSNLTGLGSAARTTASTIPELVDAANTTAGSAQNTIMNSTKTITGDLAKLIHAAHIAQLTPTRS